MLINLLPDFFAVHNSTDRVAAYLRYFENHRRFLEAYWHNYVLDPAGPHFMEVVRSAALASRVDLRTMLERIDVVSLAQKYRGAVQSAPRRRYRLDVYLMVGVGAANAGELVIDGKGVAFVCLEHFTSVTNPETQGLGLDPELIPLWLAHEIAHTVRYTSPTSRSEMKQLVDETGGYYSYWETGRRTPLRELMINEGLAIHASRAISPGHAAWEYYGYTRREYATVRELEPMMTRAIGARARSRRARPPAPLSVGRNERRCAHRRPSRFSRAKRLFPRREDGRSRPSIHADSRGQFAPAPARSPPSPRQPRLQPTLLPHTKRAEHPVEDVFDVDRADQLLQSADRRAQMHRRDGCRQLVLPPRALELRQLRTGQSSTRMTMSRSRQHRRVGVYRSVPVLENV